MEISKRLCVWLRKQPSVGEESLTDWLLFEIAERLPRVRYFKFTRWQEARTTGADWEWWFLSRRWSLGMRVQAKKLALDGDNYPGLAYANKHGMQIEKLRENATRRGLLAFYALYCEGRGNLKVQCGGKGDAGMGEGAFLAAANGLYNNHIRKGRGNVSADEILTASNPISCLFCCPMIQDPPGAEGLYHYIQSYYPDALDAALLPDVQNRAGDERLGLHSEPPNYVMSLLQFEQEVPGRWEAEYKPPVNEVKALLVVDLR
ncbi:MAG: hypothetical protein L0387_02635 [Acidobacteria bacterium]|nr:hypothetical protein [Acidobacteriota bacterium]